MQYSCLVYQVERGNIQSENGSNAIGECGVHKNRSPGRAGAGRYQSCGRSRA
jgi:hypothetical protein